MDDAANSPGDTPEALYVNDLIVPAGTTLNLDGLHLYIHTEQIDGTIVGGAVVTGEVYDDVSGSGTLTSGDSGLAGWTVELTNTSTNATYTTTTDSNGDYSFTGVAAGTYTLSEVVQSGFAQTQPASPGTYTLTIASGQVGHRRGFRRPPDRRRSAASCSTTSTATARSRAASRVSSGWTVNLLNSSNQVIDTATTVHERQLFLHQPAPGHLHRPGRLAVRLRRLVLDQRDDHRQQRRRPTR